MMMVFAMLALLQLLSPFADLSVYINAFMACFIFSVLECIWALEVLLFLISYPRYLAPFFGGSVSP